MTRQVSRLEECRLKEEAEKKDQWLLVNVQDTSNFQSLQLNADLWGNNVIKELVRSNFQFAQRSMPSEDAEQLKESYQLFLLPAVIILDPNTGQKMHEWRGAVDTDRFMEELLPYMDTPPSDPRADVFLYLLTVFLVRVLAVWATMSGTLVLMQLQAWA